MNTEGKLLVGCIESCDLPELDINDLHIRVDTGAKTSSLHVDNISRKKIGGKVWVKFDLHPEIHNVSSVQSCKALLRDVRTVKSSNGGLEERYVIRTPIRLGESQWSIDITLTNRADMSYLMLLGREAMGERLLVDPSASFLLAQEDE